MCLYLYAPLRSSAARTALLQAVEIGERSPLRYKALSAVLLVYL